jgi:hypothetical protein
LDWQNGHRSSKPPVPFDLCGLALPYHPFAAYVQTTTYAGFLTLQRRLPLSSHLPFSMREVGAMVFHLYPTNQIEESFSIKNPQG